MKPGKIRSELNQTIRRGFELTKVDEDFYDSIEREVHCFMREKFVKFYSELLELYTKDKTTVITAAMVDKLMANLGIAKNGEHK